MESKLDGILGAAKDAGKLGKYETLTIAISGTLYGKLKNGDRVKVIYLKDGPDLAEILPD